MGKRDLCSYYGCRNKSEKGEYSDDYITFHRFPKEHKPLIKWVNACQNPRLLKAGVQIVQRNRFICSAHFHYVSFVNPLVYKRRRLKNGSVPIASSVAHKFEVVAVENNKFILRENTSCTVNIGHGPIIETDTTDCPGSIEDSTEDIPNNVPAVPHVPGVKLMIDDANIRMSNKDAAFKNKIKSLDPFEPYMISIEEEEEENDELEHEEVVLNLSGLNIKKLQNTPKGGPTGRTTSLYLDNNLLQTLPYIDSYPNLRTLSMVNNQIDCLIWFRRLIHLRTLNLSKNKISDIDTIWKFQHLEHVNLSGNLIRMLRYQKYYPKYKLKHLDVSNNLIEGIEDLSSLIKLKELLLHKNCISSLKKWRRRLPKSLAKLTLGENSITNLGDFSELSLLNNLEEISLEKNCCIKILQDKHPRANIEHAANYFDYRPFIVACCPTVLRIDEKIVNNEERKTAQLLLSDEKLNGISVDKHCDITAYLSEVCPLSSREDIHTCDRGIQAILPILNAAKNGVSTEAISDDRRDGSAKNSTTSLKQNKRRSKGSSLENSTDCFGDLPCKHYIELIEERAKNHKLNRRNEVLETENAVLAEKLLRLDAALAEAGMEIEDDSKIKMEEGSEWH